MLEEANPPHPVPADPASGKVGDTPVLKPKPCVGDIYSPGQDRYSDRLDRLDIRSHQRQQHVQIVNHQVEDDVDIEASFRKRTQTVDLDEARISQQRTRLGNGWIEPLRMPDTQWETRFPPGRDNAVGFPIVSASTWPTPSR